MLLIYNHYIIWVYQINELREIFGDRSRIQILELTDDFLSLTNKTLTMHWCNDFTFQAR